jgi:hypothetical protein
VREKRHLWRVRWEIEDGDSKREPQTVSLARITIEREPKKGDSNDGLKEARRERDRKEKERKKEI